MTLCKLAAVAVATVALTGAPVFAAQPESGSRAVRYADLNLATPGGVRTLHHRIAAALETVCGSYEGTDSSAGAQETREIAKCRAAAQARADQRVAAIVSANVQVATAH